MNTTVVIVFIVGIILSVGFLLLVMSLIPTINQLKILLIDLTKTSEEVRELSRNLNETNQRIKNDLDKIDDLLDSSKETVDTVKNSLQSINKKFLRNSAGLLAMLPAIKFGWSLVKKFKGGKNVK